MEFASDSEPGPVRGVMPSCSIRVEWIVAIPSGESAVQDLKGRAKRIADTLDGDENGDVFLIDVED